LADSRPMPLLPPVMSTTSPLNPSSIRSSLGALTDPRERGR
jgi:hypothetical protein